MRARRESAATTELAKLVGASSARRTAMRSSWVLMSGDLADRDAGHADVLREAIDGTVGE